MKRFGMDSCTFAKYQKTLQPWFFLLKRNEEEKQNKFGQGLSLWMGWKDQNAGFVLSPRKVNLSLCFAGGHSICSIFVCLLKLPAGETAKSHCCTSMKRTIGWKDRMIGGFVFLSPAEENLPLCRGSGRRAMNIWCYFPRPASRCSLREGLQFQFLFIYFLHIWISYHFKRSCSFTFQFGFLNLYSHFMVIYFFGNGWILKVLPKSMRGCRQKKSCLPPNSFVLVKYI